MRIGKGREAKRNRCHTVACIRSGVACCKISSLWERGLAWMQDWKDDTSLGTRSSARHEAFDCCPSRGQAFDRPCTPANPKARQRRGANAGLSDECDLGRRLASLVRRSSGARS